MRRATNALDRLGLAVWLFAVVAVAAAVAVPAGPAMAQSDGGVDPARELFWEGNHDYAEGRYEQAIAHFRDAWELSGNERLLDYIGRCYANLGDLPAAIEAYEEFAAASDEARTEAQPILENLRRDLVGLVVGQGMNRVEDAVASARGEQPPPRDRMRRELGTRMRDVPVLVRSTPRGADVFIDGAEFGSFGVTPLETRLFTGQHVIEVRREFYEPQSRVVSVAVPRSGESVPTFTFELERQEVEVAVSVEPVTANVTYVGEDGVTRRLGLGGFDGTLPAGPGRFIVQQGGRDRRIDVVLVPGEDGVAELELFLEDPSLGERQDVRVGTLVVETELLFGEVLVDGAAIGEAPGRFERDLTPGSHRLEVRREGYIPHVQLVNIEADRDTVVVVNQLQQASRGSAGGGWALFGVGLATAGAGGYLMTTDDLDTAGLAMVAGGGALVVGGLTWAIVSKARHRDRSASASTWRFGVAPTRGGAAVGFGWGAL